MDNISQQIIKLAQKYSKVNRPVTLESDLIVDLELDSLSLTELIVDCEDEFGIEIDMDHPDTKNAKTLKDLYDGIVMLIGDRAS